jgi:hypothetical protein
VFLTFKDVAHRVRRVGGVAHTMRRVGDAADIDCHVEEARMQCVQPLVCTLRTAFRVSGVGFRV